MAGAADKLLRRLSNETDPFATREVAEQITGAVMNQNGMTLCSPSSIPSVARNLCSALCPLLSAALQETDWHQPQHLAHLDACAVLIQAISRHLQLCKQEHRRKMVAQLEASGILTALPAAMAKANAVLCAPNSPAPTDFTFTQYASFLLMLWSDILRKTTNDLVWLYGSDPLVPLLGPGPAQLAVSVLAIYAGPRGASIMAANKLLSGYEGSMLASCNSPNPITRTPLFLQQMIEQKGRTACCMAISNALLIADTFSLAAFNASSHVNKPPPVLGLSSRALKDKVLRDPLTAKLVTAMLFVQVKRLHSQQCGKAGAAAPRTRTSGRIKQSGTASDTSQAAEVPAHHGKLGSALGLDLLMTDEEVFDYVTGHDKAPVGDIATLLRNLMGAAPGATLRLPNPAALPKPDLHHHSIDSTVEDPLCGVATILACVQDRLDGLVRLIPAEEYANSRMFGLNTDRVFEAVLLTAVEVCLLAPTQHGQNALRLWTLACSELFNDFVRRSGPDALAKYTFGQNHWIEDRAPLEHPELHAVFQPVLRDVVERLVPLLLPECHDIALPATVPDPRGPGSKLSALLPQQILFGAALVSQEFLAELLQEHPVYTTRALEAALRVHYIEKSTSPVVWCSVLRAVPAVLTSLGAQDAACGSSSASSSTTAAAAEPSKLAAAAANSRQLLAQLQSLLATVVKYAGGVNEVVLTVAADPAATTSSSGSLQNEARVQENTRKLVADNRQLVEKALAQKDLEALKVLLKPNYNLSSSPGQFAGSLAVIGNAAGAAAALGRAVGQTAGGDGSSSSSSSLAAAPFVSLIGRCLYLTGAALTTASKDAPGLAAAEFDSCHSVLATLLSCLDWVAGNSCSGLLAATGAADAAAVGGLRTALQQQLDQQQQKGRDVADSVVASGLAAQLQSVGSAMCSVSTGACANPACRSLAELSELALVTPSSTKKGCGKCSGCGSCSYCSRKCQVAHWPAHKVFCKASKQASTTTTATATTSPEAAFTATA